MFCWQETPCVRDRRFHDVLKQLEEGEGRVRSLIRVNWESTKLRRASLDLEMGSSGSAFEMTMMPACGEREEGDFRTLNIFAIS